MLNFVLFPKVNTFEKNIKYNKSLYTYGLIKDMITYINMKHSKSSHPNPNNKEKPLKGPRSSLKLISSIQLNI